MARGRDSAVLFSLSNVLQNYAMDRSRNAIRALLKLRPDKATVRRGEGESILPIEALQIGDIVLIKPRRAPARRWRGDQRQQRGRSVSYHRRIDARQQGDRR